MIKYVQKYFIIILVIIIAISCDKKLSVTEPDNLNNLGIINVYSNPVGAKIFDNGIFTGKSTPDTLDNLELINHNILLKLENYLDTSIAIDLTTSANNKVFVDFNSHPRNFGSISINSDPIESEIFINGISTNQITPSIINSLLPG